MSELLKYKPEDAGLIKYKKVKCPKCYGKLFYSGKYGQTACECCDNGFMYSPSLIKTTPNKG